MRKRPKILAMVVLVFVLLVYPFKVTVAPEWNVKIVEENGKPLAGAYVLEFATHWTLDYHHEEAVCSNSNGEAHFPRRTLRASLVTRASKWVSQFGPHSSLGPDVEVGVERLGYGDLPNETPTAQWNGLANHVTTQFVLHKCPNGLTGYKCHFDYPYFFAVNGSSGQIAACQSGL